MALDRVSDRPRRGLLRLRPSLIALADHARDVGQWERAAQFYRKALDRNPRNAPIWIQYGHALKEAGKLCEPDKLAHAELAYRKALSLDPRAADTCVQLGHVLKLQGKTNEAEASYLRAFAMDPSIPYPLQELSGLGWSEAQMAGLRGSIAPNSSPASSPILEATFSDSDIVDLPRLGSMRRKLSIIHRAERARDARQWVRAAELYRKALGRNPRNPGIWVQYGHALKESGEKRDPEKLAQAEMAYRRAVSLDPSVADSYLQLGHVLKLQGKTEEAEAAYLRAFALDPATPHPLHELSGLGWSKHCVAELNALGTPDPLRDEAVLSVGAGSSRHASSEPPDPIGEVGPRSAKPNGSAEVFAEDIGAIRKSGLFDEAYYRTNNPDVPADADPIEHFVEWGARQGRKPNRIFDPAYYLSANPDVAQSGRNPLVHYIDHGIKEGRWPDRNFDPAFLLAQYSDVAEVRNNPLFRQILFREQERRIERDLAYQKWYEAHATVSSEERSQIALRLAQLQYQPLISVVLWVGSSSAKRLRGAVASIKSQLYTSWELLIALGASTEALERDVAQQLCGTDQRIRIADQMGSVGQSLALNAAFDMAIGEFILLMGDTGELSETGLYMVVEQLNQDPAADIIYSDEDKLDADGRHHEPHFKPDWNPDLFYGYNYIGNMTVCRSSLVGKVGGLNARFDGAAIYDLMLRMVEQTAASRILHIPFILYHGWSPEVVICSPPEAESQASNAARHALSDHFLRTGRSGVDVVPGSGAGLHRIVWPVPHPQPLVSLVIPPGGKGDLLRNCLFGILDRTDYDNIEVIIPYNAGTRPEVFPYFEEISADPRVTIVDSRSGYNFSRICNLGVARARGGIIGLLNDDIEVIEPGWLREMVSHAMRPEVGIVGAMLYYPNDIIQHAGVILGLGGIDGIAAHVHRSMPRGSHGYFHRAALAQDLSCVTAACLLSRRAVYSEVGGLDENIAVDFSDVDFCIKVRRRGYLIVWTPFAELYHLESATRGEQDSPEKQKQFQHDRDCIKEKWGPELFDRDPYFNPNFRRHSMGHELAAPPRVAKPWLNASHRGRK